MMEYLFLKGVILKLFICVYIGVFNEWNLF